MEHCSRCESKNDVRQFAIQDTKNAEVSVCRVQLCSHCAKHLMSIWTALVRGMSPANFADEP